MYRLYQLHGMGASYISIRHRHHAMDESWYEAIAGLGGSVGERISQGGGTSPKINQGEKQVLLGTPLPHTSPVHDSSMYPTPHPLPPPPPSPRTPWPPHRVSKGFALRGWFYVTPRERENRCQVREQNCADRSQPPFGMRHARIPAIASTKGARVKTYGVGTAAAVAVAAVGWCRGSLHGSVPHDSSLSCGSDVVVLADAAAVFSGFSRCFRVPQCFRAVLRRLQSSLWCLLSPDRQGLEQ